ncbi:hypothetical protein [Pseudomonas entomophila]|uniref:InvB/SpaK family type III secretion system chaperone n=1 Tax=Pseudomonas entomophila TaxID=312306 RepID=UPI001F00BB8C|nr:hypothetical protein [Pseudomonas entomophila]MCG8291468.1 hypothetical protein [Pseudomonas entomophila]
MAHNPLSFSDNVFQDLGGLVANALAALGAPDHLLNKFDAHSTILISLEDTPPIHISIHNNRLMIWATLPLSEAQLITMANHILPTLTTPLPGLESSGCILLNTGDTYELRGMVNLDTLNSDNLSAVIASFHQTLKDINQ